MLLPVPPLPRPPLAGRAVAPSLLSDGSPAGGRRLFHTRCLPLSGRPLAANPSSLASGYPTLWSPARSGGTFAAAAAAPRRAATMTGMSTAGTLPTAAPPAGVSAAVPTSAPALGANGRKADALSPPPPPPPPAGAATLSARGRSLLSPFPEYLQLAFAAADDPYNETTNPAGFISLSVAENRLSAPLIADRLARTPPIPPEALAYGPMCGTPALRAALADLFTTSLAAGKRVIPPEAVQLASGAGAVVDLLASVVADAGDGVLVPTPLYYGFVRDFAARAGVAMVGAPMDPAAGFAITAEGLEAAWRANAARVTPVNLRAVVVCNPGNPTGAVMPAAEVAAIVRWGRAKGIHLIFDEIYVHSTFDPPPLDAPNGHHPFVSVAEVLADAGEEGLGNDVHIVWSFSKDFCGNALRAGVLVTDNEAVREVFSTITYFSSVAVDTQAALTALLTDTPALHEYLAENRRRLSSAAASAAAAMTAARPAGATPTAVPPGAGFFLWTDLRPLLAAVSPAEVAAAAAARGVPLTGGPADAFAREYAVFHRFVRAKVLVTPGAQCCCEEAGWFRFCFASASEAEVRVAWARIEDAFRPEPVYP